MESGSPSLISLMVFVAVEHHVYLLIGVGISFDYWLHLPRWSYIGGGGITLLCASLWTRLWRWILNLGNDDDYDDDGDDNSDDDFAFAVSGLKQKTPVYEWCYLCLSVCLSLWGLYSYSGIISISAAWLPAEGFHNQNACNAWWDIIIICRKIKTSRDSLSKHSKDTAKEQDEDRSYSYV